MLNFAGLYLTGSVFQSCLFLLFVSYCLLKYLQNSYYIWSVQFCRTSTTGGSVFQSCLFSFICFLLFISTSKIGFTSEVFNCGGLLYLWGQCFSHIYCLSFVYLLLIERVNYFNFVFVLKYVVLAYGM